MHHGKMVCMVNLQSNDRVLHMSELTAQHVERVKQWARENNLESQFTEGLEYLRTYSGGGEQSWKTVLCIDTPYSEHDKSFIAHIYRRVDGGALGSQVVGDEMLSHFMTIGMIYSQRYGGWSFHS